MYGERSIRADGMISKPLTYDRFRVNSRARCGEIGLDPVPSAIAARLGRVCAAIAALAFALTVFGPASALGQSGPGFSALGDESLLVGAELGDQVRPDVDIGAAGGYVVWQDSLGDNDGFGIQARWLDGSLLTPYAKFRVNQAGEGIQEKPKVAVLSGGGAAIVWQSRVGTESDIYARFISSDRTFAGGDVLVNSHRADSQSNPRISVLDNGNVVVVWESAGQDGSHYGVFGQLFTPQGTKIGDEFSINQTTLNNQRNPSVAALAGGGFCVAWIHADAPLQVFSTEPDSETRINRIINRVYVHARLFTSDGVAAGNEFRADDSDAIAGNPAVSAASDGGFSVAWTEFITDDANRNYDIQMRGFDAAGSPRTGQILVNQHESGAQFAPEIESLGSDHLLVWTTYGQDGSQEGVFGRFVGSDGQFLSDEFAVNVTHTISKQMHPAVATDKAGQMIVAWTSFQADTSFDLFVKRYNSHRTMPLPEAPMVYRHDSQSLHVSWPALAGFQGVLYRVYLDGASEPTFVTADSRLTASGLQPSSAHSFRLAYQLADGRVSPISAAAAGVTWGADVNEDGLPDDWQSEFWGSQSASWPADSSVDSDEDGASDLEEFLAGTSPVDAQSVLSAKVSIEDGKASLQWSARQGAAYRVEKSSDLKNWTVVSEVMAMESEVLLDLAGSDSSAFYRIVLQR